MSQKQHKRYRRTLRKEMMKQRRNIVGTYLNSVLSLGVWDRIKAAWTLAFGKR